LYSATSCLPVGGAQLGIEAEAIILLGDLQRFLEAAVIEPEHDVRIHLDEAAIAVPGEAIIARGGGEADHRRVVEAEVEDGVHHARHRHARAGADRDEQRIGGVAELLAVTPSIWAMPVATSALRLSGKVSPRRNRVRRRGY
jgi:hypothetical protein